MSPGGESSICLIGALRGTLGDFDSEGDKYGSLGKRSEADCSIAEKN